MSVRKKRTPATPRMEQRESLLFVLPLAATDDSGQPKGDEHAETETG